MKIKWMGLYTLAAIGAASVGSNALAGGELSAIRVATGLNRPVELTAAPGDTDRMFIVEQRGIIKILDLNTNTVLATPFLNIDALVSNGYTGNGERGLLSMAFHPNYFVAGDPNEGYFFVHYNNNGGTSTIARYKVSADPNVADAGNVLTIMLLGQPFPNHNGGQIMFGPCDGYLYIGFGDGGAANDPSNRAQNLNLLLGKMLRIDVNNAMGGSPYVIPADNPFVGQAAREEIWAYGLRNPWRTSFDRITGDMYIGDVGQNAREEIDFQPASSGGGENYGWRCMEGNRCTSLSGCTCFDNALTDPIHEFVWGSQGRSITGGYVYRGCEMPSFQGHYFFADFLSNRIWSFKQVGGVATEVVRRDLDINPPDIGGTIVQIAAFGQDETGELYIVSRGGATTGRIYKIVPEGTPAPGKGSGPAIDHSGSDALFSGYIDPRAESTNGADLNFGPTELTITFTEPIVASDCTLTDASVFSVSATGDDVPVVTDVETCDHKTFTVKLDRPLPLQEWTTIVASGVQNLGGTAIAAAGNQGPGVDEDDRIDIGFLPADVDQTGTVAPFDLLVFRQYVNGLVTPDQGAIVDFADMDRNGSISPFDLLRFRQLINGVSPSTRAWDGETMNNDQP